MKSAGRSDLPRFPARVIATFGRTSLLEDHAGASWSAVRRGRRSDLVVGDRVVASASAPGQAAVESIEPRTSLLYRADAFRTKELAANVDQVIIVFASRPTFNLWFLWKALVAARAADIEGIVVRNKTDLEEGAEAAQAALAQIGRLGWRTAAVSARTRPDETLRDAPADHAGTRLTAGRAVRHGQVDPAQPAGARCAGTHTRVFGAPRPRQADHDRGTLVQAARTGVPSSTHRASRSSASRT